MSKDTQKIRKKIDRLDVKIVKLLEKRFALCEDVWKVKKSEGTKLKDSVREKEIVNKFNSAKLPKGFVKEFFGLFFSKARD